MMFRLFRSKTDDPTIRALYGAIVAKARDPAFFGDGRAPDTLEGRFEMMVVHMFLLLHRLKEESPDRRELGQTLFDLFFLDMDRGLRELGVGDTKVPKKIKAMGEAFYGRVKVYDEAFAGADAEALARALARNVLGQPDADASRLAAYMRAGAAELAALPYERIAAGDIAFPAAAAGDENRG